MSQEKYRLYYDNFYSLQDYSYIDIAGIDLSQAKDLSQMFDTVDELVDFRIQLQGMTIDEVKTLIFDQDLKSKDVYQKEYATFYQKVSEETDKSYPTTGLYGEQYNEVLKKREEEKKFAVEEFYKNKTKITEENKASIYRDFCIVNKNIANKMNMTPLQWEQQKMRAKFEIEAEKAWSQKVQGADYQELILDETLKKLEADQTRADQLADRFVKLPSIADSQLNFQRTLAFNALIEAGMLDEAEKVLLVYENLKDDVKSVLYGNNSIPMDNDI